MYQLLRKLKFFQILLRLAKQKEAAQTDNKQPKKIVNTKRVYVPDSKLVAYAKMVCNNLRFSADVLILPFSIAEFETSVQLLAAMEAQIVSEGFNHSSKAKFQTACKVVRTQLLLIARACDSSVHNMDELQLWGKFKSCAVSV